MVNADSTRLAKRAEVEFPALGWKLFAGQLYNENGHLADISPHELDTVERHGDKEFARAAGQVFYIGRLIHGAQESSFHIVEGDFSRDRSQLFYQEHLVAGADPETFTYRPGMWAKADRDGHYRIAEPES